MLLVQYLLTIASASLQSCQFVLQGAVCKAVNQHVEPGDLYEQGKVTSVASLRLALFGAAKVIP